MGLYSAIGGQPREEVALGLSLPKGMKRRREEESSTGWLLVVGKGGTSRCRWQLRSPMKGGGKLA